MRALPLSVPRCHWWQGSSSTCVSDKYCMDSRAAEELRLAPQIAAAQWQGWFQQQFWHRTAADTPLLSRNNIQAMLDDFALPLFPRWLAC